MEEPLNVLPCVTWLMVRESVSLNTLLTRQFVGGIFSPTSLVCIL